MMRNLIFLFLSILPWPCAFLYSQQNNFVTYTVKDGLPVSTILAIAQDSRNYLWIGTEGGGICRFDGLNFQTFTTKDGLAGNRVWSVMEDSRGDLWIGTDHGISVYNGIEFRTIRDQLGLSGSTILKLLEDKQNNIWAATDYDGLIKISRLENDMVKAEFFTTEAGLASKFVFDMYEDESGRLWLATAGGLDVVSMENENFSVQNLGRALSISEGGTTSITSDRYGNLWVGTRNSGILKLQNYTNLDSISLTVYDISSGMNDDQVWDIMEDYTGKIWIATDEGGINLISQDGFEYLTRDQGLPSNQILRLFQDRENNIWLGTYGSGLSKFLGNHFSHYLMDEQPGGYNISSILEDHNNLWLGTFGAGLIKMQTNTEPPEFEIFNKENGLSENDITSIAIDRDENVWISYSNSGIGKITPIGIAHLKEEKEMIISNSVNCLLVDSNNQLWCGTSGGISILKDGQPFMDLDESTGLCSNKIQTIIEDSAGNIWIGSLNGLMQIAWPDLIIYNEKEGLNDPMVHSLAEDSEGNIWIGTFGGGLYKLDRSKPAGMQIEPVANDELLSSNNIYSLIFQNDSILIVGTEKGFDKLFLDDSRHLYSIKKYDKSNGFIGIENNLNAICRDQYGDFWFGTANGLTRYDPDQEFFNLAPPRTYITGIKIRYEDVDWKNRATGVLPWFHLPVNPGLNWSENHITLQFSAVSLTDPEKIRYKYMLVGLDEDWSPPTTGHEVIYQKLDPGHYLFQVIAENGNGTWMKDPTQFKFSINPPFWRQWWFYSIIILITILLVMIVIRNRERKLISKNRELEIKVVERTSRISRQKEEIEAQRDEIEAQRDEIEAQRDQLVIQRDLVISQKQAMTDSINYAQRIQTAVLPHQEYMDSIMPEHFVLYKPRDIVSGDFYWAKLVHDYLIVVVADCTGHGVPGAFMSMLGITLLNEEVGRSQFDKPGEILDRLREKVKEILAQEGKSEEQKDGMDMAVLSYHKERGEIQFAGAFNPLYLVRLKDEPVGDPLENITSSNDQKYQLFEFKGDRQPIGIHSEESEFKTYNIRLKENDTLYIFSDGFVDQFGGEHRKKFKAFNFKKLLLSIQHETMGRQKQLLEEAFESWRGDHEQIDDICIIGLKIN